MTSIDDIAARMTFIGLWLYVDDYGNESAKPSLVRASIWPEDEEITSDVVAGHLLTLAERDMIRFYKVGTREYLTIVNWSKHQRVDKPSKSNVPPPPETLASDDRETLAREGKGVARSVDEARDSAREAEGEGEEREEGEGTPRDPRDFLTTEPPSPFCPAHPNGTVKPCRACGNARLAAKQWEQRHRAWMDDLADGIALAAVLDDGEVS
ncbi:hypothetical protein QT381_02670 [Galbitalea sp. SE-J8]|uniref:hypothetical protein n=1 Tax=Galbitalea sp. SE-J8 TaxID=3054952 RepID=UPI00259CC4D6|nr:hypothetical protein [Galbitalea sp. SE-J8]MDM4761907.1 hypothetical protein [Galbitalea sp. SE-J8]